MEQESRFCGIVFGSMVKLGCTVTYDRDRMLINYCMNVRTTSIAFFCVNKKILCNQSFCNQSMPSPITFGENADAIALVFGQYSLIVITFQYVLTINLFEFRSL